jgi:hypothetical protein
VSDIHTNLNAYNINLRYIHAMSYDQTVSISSDLSEFAVLIEGTFSVSPDTTISGGYYAGTTTYETNLNSTMGSITPTPTGSPFSAGAITSLNSNDPTISPIADILNRSAATVNYTLTSNQIQSAPTVTGTSPVFIIPAGLYDCPDGISANGLTLIMDGNADPNSVFIFRCASDQNIFLQDVNISLENGATANNVFFLT